MLKAAAILSTLCTFAHSYEASESSFQSWTIKHSKSYNSQEDRKAHFSTWLNNLNLVNVHNSRTDSTYRMGMNMHADLTNDEYQTFRLRPRHSFQRPAAIETIQVNNTFTPPTSKNWISEGVIVGVKDQGQCGSCWSFSAVATMEGAYNLKQQQQQQQQQNKVVSNSCNSTCGPKKVPCCSFSEQEVVDCTRNGQNSCTTGGEMHDGVMEVVSRNGQISTETNYPYVSGTTQKVTTCKPEGTPVATGITGYKNVTSGSEAALLTTVINYPIVSVGIDASSLGFQLYASGIYTDDVCSNNMTSLDHGVAVVGFGSGTFLPPGPVPPPPGPNNCEYNFKKPDCISEKGCHWCPDTPVGYCSPGVCPGSMASTSTTTKDYWIVRNSWSEDWGLGGYIAMARNHNNMCGIATDAIVAII